MLPGCLEPGASPASLPKRCTHSQQSLPPEALERPPIWFVMEEDLFEVRPVDQHWPGSSREVVQRTLSRISPPLLGLCCDVDCTLMPNPRHTVDSKSHGQDMP